MLVNRYYEVEQVRRVRVNAVNEMDALTLANVAFTNGVDANGNITQIPDNVTNPGISNVRGGISVASLSVKEERR